MQLKIRRSRRETGMVTKKVLFSVEARVQFTPQEAEDIRKYGLSQEILYTSENAKKVAAMREGGLSLGGGAVGIVAGGMLNMYKSIGLAALQNLTLIITVDKLTKGQTIECKSLDEVLGAEEALKQACQQLSAYLQAAATFDGSEVVLDFAV